MLVQSKLLRPINAALVNPVYFYLFNTIILTITSKQNLNQGHLAFV